MSTRHNLTWKTASENKIFYAIGYLNKCPIISIPITESKINKDKLIKQHNLDPRTNFVLSDKDVFMGW
jgi:hypothetical protein